MGYIFTRTDDYVEVDFSADNYNLVTRERATISRIGNSINIQLGVGQINLSFADIDNIDGVSPTDAKNAVLLLGKIFKGYPPFSVC